MTQEKLLAGVEDTPGDPIESLTSELRAPAQEPFRLTVVEQDTKPETFSSVEEAKEPSCGKEEDPWKQFVDSLSAEERKFLRLALKGEPLAGLQQYARSCSLMPEVLADGLNEKALGDPLLRGSPGGGTRQYQHGPHRGAAGGYPRGIFPHFGGAGSLYFMQQLPEMASFEENIR